LILAGDAGDHVHMLCLEETKAKNRCVQEGSYSNGLHTQLMPCRQVASDPPAPGSGSAVPIRLNAKVVIYGVLQLLLTAEVFFSGLNRDMP